MVEIAYKIHKVKYKYMLLNFATERQPYPVHRKIMHTKDAYIKNDHFDAEEATKAAIVREIFL